MDKFNKKVKVYLLDSKGEWQDCGAGNLKIVKEMNEMIEVEEEYFYVTALDNSELISLQ
jgi:hypothetical protein